jgi:hypothetical protein
LYHCRCSVFLITYIIRSVIGQTREWQAAIGGSAGSGFYSSSYAKRVGGSVSSLLPVAVVLPMAKSE